ncbi:hypothetical protein L484_015677 [Morus notabilis]|uniref:Uncharacterized protein n=1 Tax=Morus notabilis TaxID=981085 RepID=W9SAW6_9ROSA|nr:hypothetical protein L484_015677 [Morus notabilis]
MNHDSNQRTNPPTKRSSSDCHKGVIVSSDMRNEEFKIIPLLDVQLFVSDGKGQEPRGEKNMVLNIF